MQKRREPVCGWTHLAGAVLSLIGLGWLIYLTRSNPHQLIPVLIFGASLIIVYTSSTILHFTECSGRKFLWLNRLDHASIYILIAGTYTPILYNTLRGSWRWEVLASLWALALAGMVWKLLLLYEDTIWTNLYYIVAGASGFVMAGPDIVRGLPLPILSVVIAGGLVYLIGSIVFATRSPNLHPKFGWHELWHLFVLGGSGLHFAGLVMMLR